MAVALCAEVLKIRLIFSVKEHAVANALCRRMVLDNERVDDQLKDDLFNAAYEDGRDFCQLERDEVEPIFDEAFDSMVRLFSNSQVRKAMDTFADALQRRRTLSHIDVNDILHKALTTLPEAQRNALLLRDYEGYSYQEIGDITGMSESQVKVNIFRARTALKNKLKSIDNLIDTAP